MNTIAFDLRRFRKWRQLAPKFDQILVALGPIVEELKALHNGFLGLRDRFGRLGWHLQMTLHLPSPPPRRAIGMVLNSNAQCGEFVSNLVRGRKIARQSRSKAFFDQTLNRCCITVIFGRTAKPVRRVLLQ